MKAIEDQIHFLYLYTASSRQQQHALIKTMSKPQLHALLEVVFNVLKGTVELNKNNKTLLGRYKKIIRQVVDRHVSVKRKRILLQKYSKIFELIIHLGLKRIEDRHGTRASLNTKEEYELLLSKQKKTSEAPVNPSVNSKQKSTLSESNKEDLRQDEEAPVNESVNNKQKSTLSEITMEENSKSVKAVQKPKSVMKGEGKKYVRQSIEQFLKLAGSKKQRKNSKSKRRNFKSKRWIHY